jgi:hypothetical protein
LLHRRDLPEKLSPQTRCVENLKIQWPIQIARACLNEGGQLYFVAGGAFLALPADLALFFVFVFEPAAISGGFSLVFWRVDGICARFFVVAGVRSRRPGRNAKRRGSCLHPTPIKVVRPQI